MKTKAPKPKKQDTKLESEGAEFLVLGHLLVEGVSAYKAYINFPGYDLTAINPDTKKIARVQVKSRWATDYDKSFPLKNIECDFVVHVALNRGYRFGRKKKIDENRVRPPIFYVFPIEIIARARKDSGWNKVNIKKVENLERYIDNWGLIKAYLAEK